jgi:hypothetical protein
MLAIDFQNAHAPIHSIPELHHAKNFPRSGALLKRDPASSLRLFHDRSLSFYAQYFVTPPTVEGITYKPCCLVSRSGRSSLDRVVLEELRVV